MVCISPFRGSRGTDHYFSIQTIQIMTFNRGKKVSRQKIALQRTLELVQNLKLLEEKGALHINEETREVHLVREIFWDGKDLKWKRNFTANLYTMIERHNKMATGQPFHIYAIDIEKKERGAYITSFIPEKNKCQEILYN
jgi:hypothetical protein